MSSSFALPEPHVTVRRFSIPARAPRPSAMWGATVLCLGILIAALTTTDPVWWHLHFSRLGTFADASGYTFNTGVVISGLVIAAAGIPLAVNLATALSEGRVADARAARLLPPLLVTLGLCLALIGMIPLTLNEFAHDRAANGVMLSFLGLVVVSRKTLPELPRLLPRYALTAVVVLVVGITLMFVGILNLAAFEVLAFGGVLSWVHLLERAVRRLGVTAPTIAALDVDIDIEAEAVRAAAHDSIARGSRRRRPVTSDARSRRRIVANRRPATARSAASGRGVTSDLRGAVVDEDRRADFPRPARTARASVRVRRVVRGHRPPSIDRV
ncbi:MAG: hypothetical protein P0Y48_13655 [Candidatus Microbacterium phytovorans]|uniref:DUF998 domain-containing protein n=1 Tax=Candidatus Microbacterium phytovorans TaxID=3121374 RepID=A0AAJ5W353_9MICO|nr:hypothetical protein [Microbacterium sp.]WEK13485.1 MAG: hypothetical protein P0Y48_13655 [Microbacterium sp.]